MGGFRRHHRPMTSARISSGSPYEAIIGFSRAVRIGAFISIGGTASIGSDGKTVGIGDAAAQTQQIFETIKAALEQAGASLTDLIRTRILLTNIDDWQQVAEVHGTYLKDIRPVTTVMEVARFIDPDWLVEIEVDAVITEAKL